MRSSILVLMALAANNVAEPARWSLKYIDLHIAVDPATHGIEGKAVLTLAVRPGAKGMALQLSDSLTVDSARVVTSAGMVVHGARTPGHIEFPLPPAARGADYRATIWYHGTPSRRAIGFAPNSARVASYGLPGSAREWWPTLDDPSNKADSADIWITAPVSSTAVSNGTMVGRVVGSGGRTATTHWRVRHPIYSDVVSFAVGDYTVVRSSVAWGPYGPTPVALYVFPEDSAKASADFSDVGRILSFYQDRIGPYPFADEKYALVEFSRPSFREGQTLSHIGAPLITGTRANEQIFAHEIAHQWFGNSLTVKRWEDIWLNESLSEYMAWQWIRRSRGEAVFAALVDSATAATVTAPIVPANPTDFNALFGNATFQKGPLALVMLEREIGEKAFSQGLRAYVDAHQYGTVETRDLQRTFEKASGKSLSAFFAKWIYGQL